ncbi:MAG: potassium-transporting ATPase subunit KdpC [Armatimonadota bacterium]
MHIAIRLAFVTILLFGVIYPLLMTGIAQVVFPRQANGSLVKVNNNVIGSELIGQSFTSPGYFHPRPSAAGGGYDATSSGGSNLGPTNKVLAGTVRSRLDASIRENPGLAKGRVPVDMVTASGSGLDPDISVANAYAQSLRVAKVRGISADSIKRLVDSSTTRRTFGFLGEPRVNILRINRALDRLSENTR